MRLVLCSGWLGRHRQIDFSQTGNPKEVLINSLLHIQNDEEIIYDLQLILVDEVRYKKAGLKSKV